MKKKFAFILMGNHYNPDIHQACFETENQITYIQTVRNYEEACNKLRFLAEQQVGAIELCGAFGEEKARQLIAMTHNQIAIGFVDHLPHQDSLFAKFFSGF